jgi:simple sugar transport system ATP-binding protein
MEPLLFGDQLSKSYGGVKAIDEVSLQIARGEILAIVGDNGAGKSTLTKILAGALRPDRGMLRFEQHAVNFDGPKDAQRLGIEMVQQDLGLVLDFNAAENLFFGRELTRFGFLHRSKMHSVTSGILAQLGISLPDEKAPIRFLSGGQRQAVAIGRVLAWGKKLIIFDEPTAALGVRESEQVLEMIKRMRASGRSVIVVSHNMEHVLSVADRVIVMRRGKKVGDLPAIDLSVTDIVRLIVSG